MKKQPKDMAIASRIIFSGFLLVVLVLANLIVVPMLLNINSTVLLFVAIGLVCISAYLGYVILSTLVRKLMKWEEQ